MKPKTAADSEVLAQLLALADEWDRESGPGYRHPHAIQLRDAIAKLPDPRECGFMGCHHPRCAEFCTDVPLGEWLAWKGRQ
jgi:hypothetical protein